MSKIPSLFDDEFFFEEDKKTAIHSEELEDKKEQKDVNEPNEFKKNIISNDELSRSETENKNIEIDDRIKEEKENKTKIISTAKTLNSDLPKEQESIFPKTPKLELPQIENKEEAYLDKQIVQEAILADATLFLNKKTTTTKSHIPFEFVEEPQKHYKTKNTKEDKKQVSDEESQEENIEETEPVKELPKWNLDKNYYTIGEVAKMFDVNISHIRFWTTEFKLNPRTTRKGDRLFNPKEIEELRIIHYLVKVKKHTLKGAKEKLKTNKKTIVTNLNLKDSLIKLKSTMMQLKNSLSD